MKNNIQKSESDLSENQLDQMLADSVEADQSLDSSLLESRIVSQTRSMQQSKQSLLSRVIAHVLPLSLPAWSGAAVVTAGVLAVVFSIVPVRFSGEMPTPNTVIDPQESTLSETEEFPTELLWEEILLLEEELAFGSL